jgi:hypothetical protein
MAGARGQPSRQQVHRRQRPLAAIAERAEAGDALEEGKHPLEKIEQLQKTHPRRLSRQTARGDHAERGWTIAQKESCEEGEEEGQAMNRLTKFEIDGDDVVIEGVRISLAIIPEILYEFTHPDPRKWYRIERIDNNIIVHVRITKFPEENDGNPIASIGEPTA